MNTAFKSQEDFIMKQKSRLKKPLAVMLSLMLIISAFTALPVTASAATAYKLSAVMRLAAPRGTSINLTAWFMPARSLTNTKAICLTAHPLPLKTEQKEFPMVRYPTTRK